MKRNALIRRTLCLLSFVVVTFSLSGCNTVVGAYRDFKGAMDGMYYQEESNGESPRGIRDTRGIRDN